MTGMTMTRGFGLVAALAVSGTALLLAYGYKKKICLNIRRGKGCLKYEHHLAEPLKKEGGISIELLKGKDNGMGGAHLPQISRRHHRVQKISRNILASSEPNREEQLIRKELVNCSNADLIGSLHEDARTSFRAADQLVKQLEKGPETSSLKSADLSNSLDNVINLSNGADILTGSGAKEKIGGRQKKQVRFSPSVAEPSSNNHDYRRRWGQQRGGSQTEAQEQPSEAFRSIDHARPRLYSQAAKQTINYNIGRCDYRYSSRAYHPGHL